MKKKISITIENNTLKDIDSIIDNIYIRNRSQAIEHLVNQALGENRTAVILAGGPEDKIRVGKDYRTTAKINGKTIIQRAIEKLRDSGFKNIFFVARQTLLTSVFNILKDGTTYGVKLNYVEEKASGGTASSIRLLKGRIDSDFLVVYGDIIFNRINIEEIWNDHLKHNSLATIMMTTSSQPSQKGTLKVEGNKVLTFTQKPKESDIYLVFSPIFVAGPEILEYSGSSLEKDVFPQLASRNLLNGHLSSEKEIHIHSIRDVKENEKNKG
jgi:NDP-sugar pyrophosphorylase family protein